MIDVAPAVFDFEHDLEPPAWLVDGVIERGTVTVLSGDSGGGKSWLAQALAVATLTGGEWLGRSVTRGRVLYLDGEMAKRHVRDRLRAFGMTNALRGNLRYYVQPGGVLLGEPESDGWLVEQVHEHGIALVLIDSANAMSGVDVNSNTAVAALFRSALRPAAAAGAAVVLLHHERKGGEYGRNASQAVLGARQWVGQGDLVISLRATGKLVDEPGTAETNSTQRYPLQLEWAKLRDGVPDVASKLAIVSERDPNGRLVWARVERESGVEPSQDVGARLVPQIVAVVIERREATTAEIAAALQQDAGSGTFKRALVEAVNRRQIDKAGRGRYVVADIEAQT